MERWINRAAIVVRPARPYLEWASRLKDDSDDDAAEQTKELEKHVAVYLVAEDLSGKEETAPLEQYFKQIFEAELSAWWTDENDWPQERTLSTFQEWFEVARESVVTDLAPGSIKHA